MRRDEIEIGVEYAEHGPLTYGKTPSRTPARVRFISKDPQTRMVRTYRKVVDLSAGWNQIRTWWTNEYALYPSSLQVKEGKDTPVGGTFTTYRPSETPQGGLPGEITYDDGKTWSPHPVAPAAVHMTWQQYLDSQRERQESARLRRVNQAPQKMSSSWANIVEAARDLDMSYDEFNAWVESMRKVVIL